MLWKWYKKHRLQVAQTFVVLSLLGFVLNTTDAIFKPNVGNISGAVLGFATMLFWFSVILEEL